jgi:hypothetical protein
MSPWPHPHRLPLAHAGPRCDPPRHALPAAASCCQLLPAAAAAAAAGSCALPHMHRHAPWGGGRRVHRTTRVRAARFCVRSRAFVLGLEHGKLVAHHELVVVPACVWGQAGKRSGGKQRGALTSCAWAWHATRRQHHATHHARCVPGPSKRSPEPHTHTQHAHTPTHPHSTHTCPGPCPAAAAASRLLPAPPCRAHRRQTPRPPQPALRARASAPSPAGWCRGRLG